KSNIGHPQIGDRGPEGCFANTDADYQSESEQAVHQTLAELGLFGELLVEMKRLRVHRQRAEQNVVHLADGAACRMVEDLAFLKFLEVQPGHRTSLLASLQLQGSPLQESEGAFAGRDQTPCPSSCD